MHNFKGDKVQQTVGEIFFHRSGLPVHGISSSFFSVLHTVFCFICFRISDRWSSLFQLWNIICVLYRLKQSLNMAFFFVLFCFVCYTGTRFNTRVPWTYRFCSIYQAIHSNYNAVSIYGVFWWTFKVYNEFSSRLHSNKPTHTFHSFYAECLFRRWLVFNGNQVKRINALLSVKQFYWVDVMR